MKVLFSALSQTSLRSRLVVLVLLPLLGLGFVSVSQAQHRNAMSSASRTLRTEAEVTAELIDLASDLNRAVDLSWGLAAASDLGVEPAVLAGLLGLELDAWLVQTQTEVDRAFERLWDVAETDQTWSPRLGNEMLQDLDRDIHLMLDRVALGTNDATQLEELGSDTEEIMMLIVEQQFRKLWAVPGDSSLSVDFLDLSNTAESAFHLLLAMWHDSEAISIYYASADAGTRANQNELTAAEAEFRFALISLDHDLSDSLRSEFVRMVNSDPWVNYGDLRAQLGDAEISPDEVTGGNGFAASALSSLRIVRSLYDAGVQRSNELFTFQQAASDEMIELARQLEDEANGELQRSVVLLVALVAAISVGVIVTARSIILPIQAIAFKATELKAGRAVDSSSHKAYPRDLQQVEGALDDLTSSLEAVARQANLLALGKLDDPELDEVLDGVLGGSIHQSVQKLRSLTNRLEYQANHDALTGLPNRAALLRHLDNNLTGSIEGRVESTVILVDLDGFKQANDSLGHIIGDEVLCRVADRLRAFDVDVHVGRLGGDEFMLIFDKALDDAAVADITADLLGRLTDPVSSTAGVVWLSACFGIVRSGEAGWLSPSEVLQRVDVALYEGKERGPGSVVVFDQRLHDEILEQALLQSRLRRALAEGELELHYQPVLGMDGTVGLEALLRWHPVDGVPIPPDVFIAAAEQSDLILRIDDWVLEHACAQLSEWSTSPVMADVHLSINISGRHVSNILLPERLSEVLSEYDVDPGLLLLEVTETELISSIKQSVGVLSRIRELGIKLAIDDFGTGYASVAHLRRVRFDRIKIDRAFVSALDDPVERSIANLLVSLGVDLNLEVVAEGVETAEQVEWAKKAGCTHLQGYFFAKATPADLVPDLVAMLRETAPEALGLSVVAS